MITIIRTRGLTGDRPSDLNEVDRCILAGASLPPRRRYHEGIAFGACMFIGYHAKAGTENAVLDHTISSSVVRSIRVNGIEMPELGLNAAIAGCFGVPVVLVRLDARTLGFVADDYIEGFRKLRAMISIAPAR